MSSQDGSNQPLAGAVSTLAVNLLMALPARDHIYDRSNTTWGDFDAFGRSTAREFSIDDTGSGLQAA